MSATLIRTPLNWRNLLVSYALAFSFVWGLALGCSGGDWRPAAFLAAVDRSATLALDLLDVRVMSAEAYARGALIKATAPLAPVATASVQYGLLPEPKLSIDPTPTPIVRAPISDPVRAE
ncbi:MAG: hypothetical protein JNL73_16060 [Anaerolineales bacterium]|nr:hypothetical protein [Anaerolineales bacterium]